MTPPDRQVSFTSTAAIRAHYAKKREECHARYERESTAINREEQAMLDQFRAPRAAAYGLTYRDLPGGIFDDREDH